MRSSCFALSKYGMEPMTEMSWLRQDVKSNCLTHMLSADSWFRRIYSSCVRVLWIGFHSQENWNNKILQLVLLCHIFISMTDPPFCGSKRRALPSLNKNPMTRSFGETWLSRFEELTRVYFLGWSDVLSSFIDIDCLDCEPDKNCLSPVFVL